MKKVEVRIALDGLPIDEAIERLQREKAQMVKDGATAIYLTLEAVNDYGDYFVETNLVTYREDTPEEIASEKKRMEQFRLQRETQEKIEYARLKAKFG